MTGRKKGVSRDKELATAGSGKGQPSEVSVVVPRGDPYAFGLLPLLRVVFQRLGSWAPEKAPLTYKRSTFLQ